MEPQKNPQTPARPDVSADNVPKPDPDVDISLAEDKTAQPEANSAVPTPSTTATQPPADLSAASLTASEVAPAPSPATAATPPKRKKLKLFALVAGVVLVLAGGGAAAYFGYYLPNKPENVLNEALVNFISEEKARSIAYKGDISITTEADDQSLEGTFEGASDISGKLDFHLSLDVVLANLTFDARSVDGKTLYLRVDGLEGLPELLEQSGDASAAAYAPIIASINGQWFELGESLLKEWGGTSELQLSPEDMRKIAEAYDKNRFLKVKEALPDQEVGGVKSYHYKVIVDTPKLTAFLQAVKAADIDALAITEEQFKTIKDALDDSKASFEKYPLEVWIAKDTKMFKQFAFTFEDSEATFKIGLTVQSYNQPVNVEKPEGAKSILEALSDIFTTVDPATLDLQQSLEESLEGGLQIDEGDEAGGVSL